MPLTLTPDHFTVLSRDLAATEDFYTALLGFTVGPRPAMRRGGLWLYQSGRPVVHVIEVERLPEPPGGVLDHMAFRAGHSWQGEDGEPLIRALRARGLPYRLTRTAPPWTQMQLVFEGPSGETVEVDFDLE